MAVEFALKPTVVVISNGGRTAVVYDPNASPPGGRAEQIHFAINDGDLVAGRPDGTTLIALPVAEIEHLSALPDDTGGYSLTAKLTGGEEVELLAGIPYPASAAKLAVALHQHFDLPYKLPETSLEPVESLPVASTSSPRPAMGQFAYPSRPYGKLLLVVLGALWVTLLFICVFSYLTRPEATPLDTINADVIASWGLGLYGLLILLASIVFVAFLFWISKVHQDLSALSPEYPITPKQAVARAGIPIFNLWGIQNIFKTMADRNVPDIDWIMRFAYIPLLLVLWRTIRGDSALLVNLGWLGFVTFSIIITWKVDQSLAGSIGEAIYEPGSRSPAGRRGISRRLKIALVVIGLAACGVFTLGAVYVPKAIQGLLAFQEEWYDEDFDQLMGALGKRWDPDDSIPYAAANIHYLTYGEGQSEVWLLIDLQTTTRCTLRAGDPCQALADEFGRIVLDNYPRVDELDGLQVIVTYIDAAGVVEVTRSVDARQSIPEWRRELGIAKVAGDA